MAATCPRRVALITGGTSGIGLATALLFARRGWSVGLISRSREGLQAAACRLRGLGATAGCAVADVADARALQAAAEALEAELGPVTTWINVAGNGVFGQLGEIPPEEFDRVTATTYTGTVNGVRTALGLMQPQGRGAIVNVCSAIAFGALPGLSSYAGAKMAVRGFTESVQSELKLARSRITLSIIYPPAVNTPFFAHAASYLPRPPRPAAPVYQPELIAEGIYLAAVTGRPRLSISFVTVIFELAGRLIPGITNRAIGRLGYEGQMTDLPEALALRDPCLFGPGAMVTGTRGPFPARAVSSQLWLARLGARIRAGLVLTASRLVLLARPRKMLGGFPDAPHEPDVQRPPVG